MTLLNITMVVVEFSNQNLLMVLNVLAPVVMLTSNAKTKGGVVNVSEGSAMSFSCKSVDDILPGDQFLFNFNGKETIKLKVMKLCPMISPLVYSILNNRLLSWLLP